MQIRDSNHDCRSDLVGGAGGHNLGKFYDFFSRHAMRDDWTRPGACCSRELTTT